MITFSLAVSTVSCSPSEDVIHAKQRERCQALGDSGDGLQGPLQPIFRWLPIEKWLEGTGKPIFPLHKENIWAMGVNELQGLRSFFESPTISNRTEKHQGVPVESNRTEQQNRINMLAG